MKLKILSIGLVGLIVVACSSTKDANSAQVMEYGPAKVDSEKAISVVQMLKDFEGKSGQESDYTIEAKISQVCAKAGCWVNVDKGNGETFMVRFKDHFTIPTTTNAGTKAIIHGQAYMDTTSVDMLRHFAEDAGQTKEEIAKITQPKFNLNFEADAIRLLK
jgi:hypothetical protein